MKTLSLVALALTLITPHAQPVLTTHAPTPTHVSTHVLSTETTKTTETTSRQPRDEHDTGWACWAQGNHVCSVLPLVHRSTHSAPCEGDEDCQAWWDRALVRGHVL
jgi:hypothetical protein